MFIARCCLIRYQTYSLHVAETHGLSADKAWLLSMVHHCLCPALPGARLEGLSTLWCMARLRPSDQVVGTIHPAASQRVKSDSTVKGCQNALL